jgi:hypothetical protein
METLILMIGAGIFFVSAALVDSEGKAGTIACITCLIGLIIIFIGAFLLQPQEVEAEEYRARGAGVTAHMNATLHNALQDMPELKLTNEEEISLLARLITAETGGTDEYLSYLTGSVVINRMNNPSFPDTLFGVIYQKNQYECTWNGHIYRPYTDLAWEIAEELLTYGTTIPENVLFQAEFEQANGVYQKVGNTYFCWK